MEEEEGKNIDPKKKWSYQSALYWDNRYSKSKEGETFDWYVDYEGLRPHLMSILGNRTMPRMINLGCGNSELSTELYADLKENIMIYNVDISKVVIEDMKKKYNEEYPTMEWLALDAQDMTSYFKDTSIDLIIEKGLMDALVCGNNEINILSNILTESYRILKPGAVLAIVTHGHPDHRLPYLNILDFDIKYEKIPYSVSSLSIRFLRKILKGQPVSTASKLHYRLAAALAKKSLENIDYDKDYTDSMSSPVAYLYLCTKPLSSKSSTLV